MCGIAGLYGSFPSLEENIKRITRTLSHRGPDAEGFYVDHEKGLALGHRRLSILDLTELGNQPFHSKCGRYVTVYNGEVYNYKEIAKNLNLEVITHCDTEVIIEAYAKLGNNFVNQLKGMFAIAIWDKDANELKLFRDRIGIKPLYYYWKDGLFAFASEIKALTCLFSEEKLGINYQSVVDFLHLGYISQERTIYDNILKVPNGHYLSLASDKTLRTVPFWLMEDQIENVAISDENAAKELLKIKLNDAVDKQLIADVPIGTFLSGGIDSSIVTAISQDLANEPVNTFSIGFKDSKFNESHYAKKVAQALGTNHNEFLLTEKDAVEQVDKLLEVYDEPFGDSSAIPTLMVSELARKHVSVALSGDGGDEQFLGYGRYEWAKRLNNPFYYALRKQIAFGLKLSGSQRLKKGALIMDVPTQSTSKSHIFSQEQCLFSLTEINDMLVNPIDYYGVQENWKTKRILTPMESHAYFDLKNYLKDDLLVKVDRASMFHSLEVRVPLLDHEIVAFSLNLDSGLKIKNGITKYLLKQVLYDYVPAKLFDRPKWGFSVPMEKWLKNDLKYLLDKYLNREVVEVLNVVHFGKVEQLIKRYMNGEAYLYNRIWVLLQLHRFLKGNK